MSKITDYLSLVEKEYNVDILFAVESGSRAWGTNSPESDYDVKFIYREVNKHTYLSLFDKRDVIERVFEDLYELGGWNIKKTMQLAVKTNPALMEWLLSHIVYKVDFDFYEAMKDLMKDYSPKNMMFHYCGLSERQIRAYLLEDNNPSNKYKAKKWLYAIRPLLACQWMIDNEYKIPPIIFEDLLIESDYVSKREIDECRVLLKVRRENNGEYYNEHIRKWIDSTLNIMKEEAHKAPTPKIDVNKAEYMYRRWGFYYD